MGEEGVMAEEMVVIRCCTFTSSIDHPTLLRHWRNGTAFGFSARGGKFESRLEKNSSDFLGKLQLVESRGLGKFIFVFYLYHYLLHFVLLYSINFIFFIH